jgi:hypothetical protein
MRRENPKNFFFKWIKRMIFSSIFFFKKNKINKNFTGSTQIVDQTKILIGLDQINFFFIFLKPNQLGLESASYR